MFDNLRQQSMDNASHEETPAAPSAIQSRGLSLLRDLTPQQRFILALLFFLNVTVLGCAALFVFGRVALPF